MAEKYNEISELLRSADKLIKEFRYEEALTVIDKVFTLDQRNVYAKAYKERITYLISSQPLETRIKNTEVKSPQKSVEAQKEEPKKEPAPPSAPKVEVKKNIPPPPPLPQPALVPEQTIERKQEAQPAKVQKTPAALEAYKTLLLEIWRDGSISIEEQARINSMRETFAISEEEHKEIENDVRITSYLSMIKKEWQKGITNFEPLRKKFKITNQEQNTIEPKLLTLVQSLQSKGSVLVLDDEEPFLKILKDVLHEAGYYCFTSTSGEEALHLLETMTPDLVLCDVNFAKPNMSGFAFYEKFRSIDKFIATPFIFLSGLDQDVLIRTGKKLGADDYLTKPIDTELLIATVEGKLRRSRELKRSINI